MGRITFLMLFSAWSAWANPYWDESAVPKDQPYRPSGKLQPRIISVDDQREALDILRIEVAWTEEREAYDTTQVVVEKSGTPGLMARAEKSDPLGSYQATLRDTRTGKIYYSTIGTGQEYRKLVRAFTFRFPLVENEVEFQFNAENPETGNVEEIFKKKFQPPFNRAPKLELPIEVKELKKSSEENSVSVVIYSEGYTASGVNRFNTAAQRAVEAIQTAKWPGVEKMNFYSVFSPSNVSLGSASDLGMPIPERDSFLGLYFPYWRKFGRWYHVVYPTRESRFRARAGMVAYDYPIVLVDSNQYWGVGNFNENTAIPAENSSFTYLLLHEFGHFFGLNEEYEGGGPTELAFAPGIVEPWSQNITFLPVGETLKWKWAVENSTPIPTPNSLWSPVSNGPLGAYRGGYADTEPLGQSHKPGHACVMKSGKGLCKVCHKAVKDRVEYDAGVR